MTNLKKLPQLKVKFSDQGIVLPDASVRQWARNLVDRLERLQAPIEVEVASEVLIDALRAEFITRGVDGTGLILEVLGEAHALTRLCSWPPTAYPFPSISMDLLETVFIKQSEIAKKERKERKNKRAP